MVQVSAGKKFHSMHILQKHHFQLLMSKTRTFYLALSLFGDITSLTFQFLMNSESIVSPVNRDFLFDWVNFIVEPLRVSVNV